MTTNASRQLREWADNRQTEQASFAAFLADSLDSNTKTSAWSLIDIRREFEARAASPSRSNLWRTISAVLPFVRPLVVAAYLFPVIFTWYELSNVLPAFADFSSSTEAKTNLITFWAGGYEGAFKGTSLSTVAIIVALVVLIIVVLQMAVTSIDNYLEPDFELSQELNQLILTTQLEVAQSRALTAQDVTDSIGKAAEHLENALKNVDDSVQSTVSMVEQIATVAEGLGIAAISLKDVSNQFASSLTPISDLKESLQTANSAIVNSTGAMDAIQRQTNDIVKELSSLRNVGGEVESIQHATVDLLSKVNSAGTVVQKAAEKFGMIIASSEAITRQLQDINVSTEQHEPHLVALRDIAQSLNNTGIGIGQAVQEVKRAVEDFARINQRLEDELNRG